MYAIVKDGGHQFKAVAGRQVRIERRPVDSGQELTFDQVLMVGGDQVKVGTPTVPGARVIAVVAGETKGPKVRGIKKRQVNSSQTRFGHRQKYMTVVVKEIVAG